MVSVQVHNLLFAVSVRKRKPKKGWKDYLAAYVQAQVGERNETGRTIGVQP